MVKVHAELKTTSLYATANPDSNLSTVNVLTLMNVASPEPATLLPFVETPLDHLPVLVQREVLETQELRDANPEVNVPKIETALLLQHAVKADVLILAWVNADEVLTVKCLLTNPSAHALPEPKETLELSVDNWSVLKTQNVLWVGLVCKTNVLMPVALPEFVAPMPFAQY